MGGAEISKVHANFIVNNGDARAEDVLELMALIETKVYENFEVELEPEIRAVGDDG